MTEHRRPRDDRGASALPRDPAQERHSGGRQLGAGLVLLVVGIVLAVLLVDSEATTLAAAGYVVAIAGLLLLGNGLLLRRRSANGSVRS